MANKGTILIYKKEGYGLKQRGLSLFFILFLFLTTPPSTYSNDLSYEQTLINKALSKELFEDRYWHTLLHYKGSYNNYKSLIDDPKFFLSPDGKRNPKEELIATIKSFFNVEKLGLDNPLHSQCRFIARYNWLKEKLNIDNSKLLEAPCQVFYDFVEQIKPTSATLIFPTAHMNNPASMFGHTLVRINTEYESKLLSYALNYSALTKDTNGVSFAFKGLFGLFRGGYSIHKYFEKVNDYSDIKFRDIWEYELNFSKEEVINLLMHLWELTDVYSDYYFLDENCSYNLLFLLESARRGLNLTDDIINFGFWVIPIDTIRKVKDNSLITESVYRPSKASRIQHMASLLSSEEQEMSSRISKGIEPPTSVNKYNPETQIKILDLSAEFSQAQFAEFGLSRADYRKTFMSILNTRKDLGMSSSEDHYNVPPPPEPTAGHKSAMIGIGGGVKRRATFAEFKYRSAFHHMLDLDIGFLEGSAIEFPGFTVRNYTEEDYFEFEEVKFISITSLSPRDIFFKPLSWSIYTGLKQKTLADDEEHMTLHLNVSRGISYNSKTFGIYSFKVELEALATGAYKQNHSAGLGGSFEITKSFGTRFKSYAYLRGINHSLGDKDDYVSLTLGQIFKLTENTSLKLHLMRDKNFGHYKTGSSLELSIYY